MVTFKDYKYIRPDLPALREKWRSLLSEFGQATSADDQNRIIEELNKLSDDYSTQSNLAFIRASIDTNDEFYQEERDYFDEIGPEFDELNTEYYKALVSSPYREDLEARWGTQLFAIADQSIRSFSPEAIPLLQKENRLSSEYSKLTASAQIEFDGKTLTLAQLVPYTQSTDRAIRKQAVEATFGFYAEHEEQFNDIYDRLVKVRHEIALTLGYKDFVEVGFLRMNRIGYDRDMVKNFRDQVKEHIVPLATKLFERQATRIGVDPLFFHDEGLNFTDGNAKPAGPPEWILENGKKMYDELSPETSEFFHFMMERELMDLEAKKGKEGGGYCTFIDDYQSPFIFSNFNGTSHDIDVLTHEAGHAFQVYASRNIGVPEYIWPTTEAAEIHSMSMEFFTWPWMELFFKDETEKYKFTHLSSALLFLPYGVAVDEFQQIVYEKPEMTPAERKQAWKSLEEKYLPHRNYDGIPFLEAGGIWQRQSHIYEVPFYYIDYCLAQICALQFWKRSREEREAAWNDYLRLCRLGGSQAFPELVKAANLMSPFEDGCIESVVGPITEWLDAVDDRAL
ncbi:M3 family oligoendopeptidase [Bhargavaea cecembensis]|uniref:M3 family oligoendopeptidase n=1 Tax=Bhargavaea cecembensis TaxID=394098 RepID=UPI00058C00B4|nr:M3 family oligoendopeptidase [Bhargavaea cecembensis]